MRPPSPPDDQSQHKAVPRPLPTATTRDQRPYNTTTLKTAQAMVDELWLAGKDESK